MAPVGGGGSESVRVAVPWNEIRNAPRVRRESELPPELSLLKTFLSHEPEAVRATPDSSAPGATAFASREASAAASDASKATVALCDGESSAIASARTRAAGQLMRLLCPEYDRMCPAAPPTATNGGAAALPPPAKARPRPRPTVPEEEREEGELEEGEIEG